MSGDFEVIAADESLAKSWDDFVHGNADSSVTHLWAWRGVISDVFGRETHYLAAQYEGAIVGVLPLVRLKSTLFGDFLVSVPYMTYGGVVAESAAAETALIESAIALGEDLGVSHIEFRHTTDVAELPKRTEKISMRLELCGDPDTLWKQLGSKRRAQIRRPEKEGASIEVGGAELLDDFYSVFATKYRDLGIPVYPRAWFKAVLETFGDRSRVFVARLDGQAAAASIVIGFRNRLEVPWAASVRSADRVGINMFLYWEMLKHAEAGGYTTFDFGRCTKDTGTWRFKKQWGAQPVQLYWHYWLKDATEVPQLNAGNSKYQLAVSLWQKMPVWVTRIVGPQIVKNLP